MRDYWMTAALEVMQLVDPSPAPAPAAESDPKSVQDAILQTLIAAGPVGVFFLAVIFKFKLMTVSEHNAVIEGKDQRIDSLEKDVAELKASLREANGVYTTQVIPTLTRVLDAERELVELRRQEQQDQRWREQRRRDGRDESRGDRGEGRE